MLLMFYMLDAPGMAQTRARIRPEHKAYLAQQKHAVAFAGPLYDDTATKAIGSLLVMDFESLASARRWLAHEPFTQAGVYAEVTIRPFENLWPQRVGFAPEQAPSS